MRWFYVFAGFIINLCLGAIYSYSVLQVHLRKLFENDYGIKVTATQMQAPYLIFLALFSFSMPLAGKLIEKYGIQKIGIIGGALLSLAWFSSSFAKSPIELYILYGVMGGIGVGMVYNSTVTTITMWFPKKRGLAIGITLMGFGISAAIISPLIDILAYNYGISQTLRIVGITFFILISLLFYFFRLPKDSEKINNKDTSDENYKEILKSPSFYGLWISFTTANIVGLTAIGISKQVGLEIVSNSTMQEREISKILTLLMIPFAICNGIGRPLFGWLTEKLTPKPTITLSFSSIIISIIFLYTTKSLSSYIIAFCVFWLNLGGWMAIAPTTTAMIFGLNNYSSKYGIVFTAYGIGAITGNLLAGITKDLTASYLNVFPILTVILLISLILSHMLLKYPKS